MGTAEWRLIIPRYREMKSVYTTIYNLRYMAKYAEQEIGPSSLEIISQQIIFQGLVSQHKSDAIAR